MASLLERPTAEGAPLAAAAAEVVYIKPHLLALPCKGGLLRAGDVKRGQAGGALALDVARAAGSAGKLAPAERDYCVELGRLRDAAVGALGDLAWDRDALDRGVAEYLGLLQGLTGEQPEVGNPLADGAAATAASTPKASTTPRIAAALSFQWYDLLGAGKPVAGDAHLELRAVLLSLAVWKTAAAAAAHNHPRFSEGVSSAETAAAYQLVREAAGLAGLASKLPPAGGASRDLQPPVLAALEAVFLADAQSLTTLRALAKGASHSVVAAVARDTSELYSGALQAVPTGPGSGPWESKLRAYTTFKAEAFAAHAHIALAQQALSEDRAGDAVRSAEEARSLAAAAAHSAQAYDKAAPASDPQEHAGFSGHLRATVEHAADKITRMNSMIYYKAPAAELPQLPEPTRLAAPLPYTLPVLSETARSLRSSAPAAKADAAGADGGAHGPNGNAPATPADDGEAPPADRPGKPNETPEKPGKPGKQKKQGCCCVVQ
eukprot:jgi/Tetstr1/441198/TSEL_029454.t1